MHVTTQSQKIVVTVNHFRFETSVKEGDVRVSDLRLKNSENLPFFLTLSLTTNLRSDTPKSLHDSQSEPTPVAGIYCSGVVKSPSPHLLI
jgi:hypothetical protein